MLLENNDCDLVCKGCELEDNPEKCFQLMAEDIKDIRENEKIKKMKKYSAFERLYFKKNYFFHKWHNTPEDIKHLALSTLECRITIVKWAFSRVIREIKREILKNIGKVK